MFGTVCKNLDYLEEPTDAIELEEARKKRRATRDYINRLTNMIENMRSGRLKLINAKNHIFFSDDDAVMKLVKIVYEKVTITRILKLVLIVTA